MKKYITTFPGTAFAPVTLPEGANLSETLTILNSPMLFGCRSGICGTCLIQLDEGYEKLTPPSPTECEALEVYAPGNQKARLACQILLVADIALKKIQSM